MSASKPGVIICTRMSSNRLPGKALIDLCGKPMLQWVYEAGVDAGFTTVIATSTDESDDAIADFAGDIGAKLFRGDLTDVLGRFLLASVQYQLDPLVRITHDCPLVNAQDIKDMVEYFIKSRAEYLTQDKPRGRDIEVFSQKALLRAYKNATTPEEREHVTLWMRKNLTCSVSPNQRDNGVNYEVNTYSDLQRLRNLIEQE